MVWQPRHQLTKSMDSSDIPHFSLCCVLVNLNYKQITMSRELMEFSDQIDELFDPVPVDPVPVEPDDFWEDPANLFVYLM